MDSLCLWCSVLFPIQPCPAQGPITHHRTVGELSESVQNCGLCSTIQRYWSLRYLQRRFPDLEGEACASLPLTLRVTSPGRCATGASWFLLLGKITADKHKFAAHFELTITTYDPASPARDSSLWRGAESSLKQKCALIKSWYDECANNHPECIPSQDQYPGRLIDVGADGRSLRLISTKNNINKGTPYATLSHCWGNVKPPFTTTDNVEQLSKIIPVEYIPATFREAILITRELGIPYIWIDSLCIIQDNPEDWAMEAARMKNTYFCSAVTISALDAQNCTHGCFVDSGSDLLDPIQAQARVTRLLVLPAGGQVPIPLRVYEGDVQYPMRTAILRTRGWTLQEELLTPREILCMRPEIRWKCQQAHRTEVGHLFGIGRTMSIRTHNGPLDKLRRLWYKWMQNYSSRVFTFEIDRLRALVGMIYHYGNRTGYNHVLASWRETMIDDLLWLRGRDIVDASTVVRAIPSWSWLTRAKNIVFDFWNANLDDKDHYTSEDHTTVVEASVDWDGEPMLSDIVTSSLVLRGPVQQMRLRVDPRAMDFNPPYLKVGDEEPDLSSNPIPWRCAGQLTRQTCGKMKFSRVYSCGQQDQLWRPIISKRVKRS